MGEVSSVGITTQGRQWENWGKKPQRNEGGKERGREGWKQGGREKMDNSSSMSTTPSYPSLSTNKHKEDKTTTKQRQQPQQP